MKIAIFDLDGCLADDRRRRPLLPRNGHTDADYEAYHVGSVDDPVINKDVVMQHKEAGHHLLFITARPQRYLQQTVAWLEQKIGVASFDRFTLLMRPDGNHMPSPELKVHLFEEDGEFFWPDVVAAYDDRHDILAAYQRKGVDNCQILSFPKPSVPSILREMARTYEERNVVYKDNFRDVAKVMAVFFPDGVPPNILHTPHFNLFEMIVGKMTRFVNSDLNHADSIHDIAVYAAMIEAVLHEESPADDHVGI